MDGRIAARFFEVFPVASDAPLEMVQIWHTSPQTVAEHDNTWRRALGAHHVCSHCVSMLQRVVVYGR